MDSLRLKRRSAAGPQEQAPAELLQRAVGEAMQDGVRRLGTNYTAFVRNLTTLRAS